MVLDNIVLFILQKIILKIEQLHLEQAKLNTMLVSMRASLKETESVKESLQKNNSYRGNTKKIIEQSIIHHEAEIQRLFDKINVSK